MAIVTERILWNRSALARRWGLDEGTIRRRAKVSALYRPFRKGLPGDGAATRRDLALYHRRQVELLEAVMLDAMNLDEAELRWAKFLADARAAAVGEVQA